MSGNKVIFSLALAGLAIISGCRKNGEEKASESSDSSATEKSASDSTAPEVNVAEEFDSIHFISPGVISHYDDIFRKEATAHGIDWRLLAAVGYTESRFHENLVSAAGAKGLMQLMPSIARSLGFSEEEMMNPALSIRGGAMSIERIIKWVGERYNHENPENLMKIAIATYNCGPAHMEDAMTIAKMKGLDAGVWDGNLEKALEMKINPEVYGNPKVKFGRFGGAPETKAFVNKVYQTYNIYKKAGISE